jgi:hypothetical protein
MDHEENTFRNLGVIQLYRIKQLWKLRHRE